MPVHPFDATSPRLASVSAQVLEIGAHPPPRGGWSIRIEMLKNHLNAQGHHCVVLNIGRSRTIPSDQYETVVGPWDFVSKVRKYARMGFVAHTHANGEVNKGLALALTAQFINRWYGTPCVLTFHAGIDQAYFPREKSPLMAPLFRLLFSIPRRIVCNSESVRQKIAEYGVPATKVRAIPAFTRQYLDFERVPLTPVAEDFLARHQSVILCYIRLQPGYFLDVLLDGFARVAARRSDAGLLVVGVDDGREERLWEAIGRTDGRSGLAGRICAIGDVDHDEFLTLLTRSSLYLRTPTSDGIASSVLEALALRVPVVGSDNGSRPAGTITYPATDAVALADRVCATLERRDEIAAAIVPPPLPDTLADEIALLTGGAD